MWAAVHQWLKTQRREILPARCSELLFDTCDKTHTVIRICETTHSPLTEHTPSSSCMKWNTTRVYATHRFRASSFRCFFSASSNFVSCSLRSTLPPSSFGDVVGSTKSLSSYSWQAVESPSRVWFAIPSCVQNSFLKRFCKALQGLSSTFFTPSFRNAIVTFDDLPYNDPPPIRFSYQYFTHLSTRCLRARMSPPARAHRTCPYSPTHVSARPYTRIHTRTAPTLPALRVRAGTPENSTQKLSKSHPLPLHPPHAVSDLWTAPSRDDLLERENQILL